MTKNDALAALQDRLGYTFKDVTLLQRALTHSSVGGRGKSVKDLERLEFLGDRVLGLLTAETLWRRFPEEQEGELATRFNGLVRKEACAKAALVLGLDEVIVLSKSEEQSGGRKKKAILGDVCEAVLGAAYIDGGLEAARAIYDLYWPGRIEETTERSRDAKTELQEWAQAQGLETPDYLVTERDGPDHAPQFRVEARVKGRKPAKGKGSSKREAQQAAAAAMLVREGIWKKNDAKA